MKKENIHRFQNFGHECVKIPWQDSNLFSNISGTDAGKSPSKSPEAKVPAKKTPPPSKKVSSTSSTSAASSNTR